MNRSILIITPYFAPQSHAAVFRAYKLAKLLPRFGWKPYVLTVDRNYLYNEDPGLLADLPAEVTVHTARYVEPTLRGLRMALGGRDRSFAALKREGSHGGAAAGAVGKAAGPGLASRLYRAALDRFAQSPHAHWTWRRPVVREARRLIREHDIPLVFTSANPFTCHRIGRTLQKDGTAWIADLRDPHAYFGPMHSRRPGVYARQRRLEEVAARHADAVTVASSAIAMILGDSYGPEILDRTHFIPTGLDQGLLDGPGHAPDRERPYLLFTGEYLPDYGPEFLECFAEALRSPEVRAASPKLLIVGRMDVNAPLVTPHVRRLWLEADVELRDHVPQRELYRLLQGASAGVLLSARNYRWWCLQAKLVDYLAMRKPVAAIVPDPSEARSRLNEARLGVFLDGDRHRAARMIGDLLLGRSDLGSPDEAACDRFLATTQVQAFAQLFESLLEGRADGPHPGAMSYGLGNEDSTSPQGRRGGRESSRADEPVAMGQGR